MICGILSNAALSALMNKIVNKTSKNLIANGINTAPFAFFMEKPPQIKVTKNFVCFLDLYVLYFAQNRIGEEEL